MGSCSRQFRRQSWSFVCRESVITIVSGGNRIQLGAWRGFIVVLAKGLSKVSPPPDGGEAVITRSDQSATIGPSPIRIVEGRVP